jgi:hypothetical protein
MLFAPVVLKHFTTRAFRPTVIDFDRIAGDKNHLRVPSRMRSSTKLNRWRVSAVLFGV